MSISLTALRGFAMVSVRWRSSVDLLTPVVGLSVFCSPVVPRAFLLLNISFRVLKVLLRDSSDDFCERKI